MVEKTYSQREFATLVGLSTATVSRMVASRKIRTVSEGDKRIPASEVDVILREQLQKFRKFNQLFLIARGSGELFEETKADIKNYFEAQKASAELRLATPNYVESARDIVPRYIDSLEEVFTGINDYKANRLIPTQDLQVKLQNKMLLEALIAEFITRYRGLCLKKIASFADDGTTKSIKEGNPDRSIKLSTVLNKRRVNEILEKIPLGILKNVVFYGLNKVELPEELREVSGVSEALADIDKQMKLAFDTLMYDLSLIQPEDTFLFERADLSADFFDGQGDIYDKAVNNLIRGISSPLAEEVRKKVKCKFENAVQKSAVENTIDSGVYMIVNICANMSKEEINKVIDLLDSNVFGTVSASGVEGFPEILKQEVERLQRNHSCIINAD